MRLLDRLERRIGWFAIRNLAIYIVIGNAIVWLIGFVFIDGDLVSRLVLVPDRVFSGEIWRVFTFIFLNAYGGFPFFVLIELYFIYMIGQNLESYWGAFRFTFYYFFSILLTVAVSLLTGISVAGARYVHLSLFFAFAAVAPDMQLLLFFIIPVKIKYLSWIAWAFTAYEFVSAPGWPARLIILASLVAYAMFFGAQIRRQIKSNRKAHGNRRDFNRKISGARVIKASFHKCEVCGVTEKDSPDMDFRYCSKCEGNYEYCAAHIRDHIHRSG
jgi:membrane associated rhomboid family serine protease